MPLEPKRDLISVRVTSAVREAFEARSEYEGVKVGTIAARVLGQAAKRWQNTAPAANHRDER